MEQIEVTTLTEYDITFQLAPPSRGGIVKQLIRGERKALEEMIQRSGKKVKRKGYSGYRIS
ncbi:hypothetical protein HS7_19570 [Sulfolobales archaeon HS-7]|nr:hypothetical protein HS7_19570 [Sulfolobales archaeon HS-7]